MIPDGIEPITAYRAFLLHKSGWLKSTYKDDLWEPGVNEAYCDADLKAKWVRKNVDGELKRIKILWHGLIPEPKCDCGFWLLNSQQAVVDYFFNRGNSLWDTFGSLYFGTPRAPDQYVLAEVKAWGRVIQAENGFRTEFASIAALLDGPTVGAEEGKLAPSPLVHALAERYGVPVVRPEYRLPKKEEPAPHTHGAGFLTGSASPFLDASGVIVPNQATIGKITGG